MVWSCDGQAVVMPKKYSWHIEIAVPHTKAINFNGSPGKGGMMFSQLHLPIATTVQRRNSREFKMCIGIIALAMCFLCLSPAAHAQRAKVRNGLAPVTMDSFVRQAGSSAELIYGDESPAVGRGEMKGGPPPYYGFSELHRIESGIVGQNADGLTTGHGSYLPSAWGRDQFTKSGEKSEWSQSGASNETKQLQDEFAFVIPQ
jgi:hypothetical protein